MNELRECWLTRARPALRSYRQMYALALEISRASEDDGVRRAAKLVVNGLGPLMDLPLAESRELSLVMQEFVDLISKLEAVRTPVQHAIVSSAHS